MPDDESIIRLASVNNRPRGDDETTEDALALEFSRRHADDLRYVAIWGRWLHWNSTKWEFEDTLKAYDLSRDVVRDAAQKNQKRSILSASTVAAVERLAKADRRHAAIVDQWDADLAILTTPRERSETNDC
jgi:putative DNA primase/helicase